MANQIELTRRQRVLANFGDFVLDHEDLDDILQEGCRLIALALDADLAKVIEIEPEAGTGFVRAGVGWNPGIVGQQRIILTDRSSEAYAIRIAQPVISNNIVNERRFEFPGFLLDHGVVALVNVPILLPGRKPWGVLQVDASKIREFDQDDIEFLKTYAMVLGPVIDRLRVAAEEQRARSGLASREAQLRSSQADLELELRHTALLRDLAARMVSEESLPAAYSEILSAAVTLTEAQAGTVQVYEPATRSLAPLVSQGLPQHMATYLSRVDADSSTAGGIALMTGQRAFVDFDRKEPDEACGLHVAAGLRSAQATPLLTRDGAPIGMITTHWEQAGRWLSEPQTRFLDLLARQAADLIEHHRAEANRRLTEERQAFLLKFSDAVRPLADPPSLQTAALKLLAEHLGLVRAAYYEIDDDQDGMTLCASVTADAVGWPPHLKISDLGADISEAYRAGQVYEVGNVDTDARLTAQGRSDIKEGLGILRLAGVPLVKGGELKAVLGVHARAPRPWRSHELGLLSEVVDRTWSAVERAQAEVALRENEDRLGLAVDIGELASWDWDVASGKVTWNDRHFLLQGYAVGEVTPSFDAWLARVHPEDREETVALIEAAREQKGTYVHDFRALHNDGTIVWCSARGRFFYDSAGMALRMIGVMEDVTEQKLAEKALLESEERQSFLLKLSDALRAMSDPHRMMCAAAELFARRLDLSVVHYLALHEDADSFDILGGYTDGRVPAAVGMTAGRISDHGPGWGEPLRRGEALFFDDSQNAPQADARATAGMGIRSGSALPLLRNGRLVAILGTGHHEVRHWSEAEKALQQEVAERTWAAVERARAQTALRHSEERFRQFAQASAAGLWIRDARQLDMEFASPAISTIYGVEPGALLGNVKHWAALIVPEDRIAALEHLDKA